METNKELSQPDVRILIGSEATSSLKGQRLRELTEHVVRHTTAIQTEETRGRMSRLIGMVQSAFSLGKKPQVAAIPEDHLAAEIEYVESFQKDDQLAVAMVGGEAVGMLGYKLEGFLPSESGNTRPVFELHRASVLPAYEGKGIFTQLKSAVIQKIISNNPDALIASITKNPAVQKTNAGFGFEEIPPEDLMRLRGWPEERIQRIMANDVKKEWRAYLLDPKRRAGADR